MNLKNLQYLLHVAQTENISRSARELFIAQPALSRLIADAEKELGYPLFDRYGKRIVLNQNGTIFIGHARQILAEWHDMERELDESNHTPDPHLSVGVEACSQLLPSILQLFQAEHPHAEIQILHAYPLDLKKEQFDLLIKAESAAEKTSFSADEQLLLREDILLALPEGHPLASCEAVSFEDTLDHPYVLPSLSSSLGMMLSLFFESAGLAVPERSTTVNNSYLQCEFVEKGLGISLVPAVSWNYIHGNRSLVLKKLNGWGLERVVYLTSDPSRYQTGLARSFKQFLVRYFEALSDQNP